MKQAICRLRVVLAGVFALTAGSAIADGLVTPCWRNLTGTTNHSTYQSWSFDTDTTGQAILYSTNWSNALNPGAPFANGSLVPDNDLGGWSDTRSISTFGTGAVLNAAVNLHLTGGWNGDLRAWLMHDTGFAVLLDRVGTGVLGVNPNGYGDPGMDVTLQSTGSSIHQYGGGVTLAGVPSGTWRADSTSGSLDSFLTTPANGAWTLLLTDSNDGDVTTVQSWGLQLDVASGPLAFTAALPEVKFNPGNPTAHIHLGTLASGWLASVPFLGSQTGVWELGSSGSIDVTIPETAGSVNGYRYVVVQATGYRDGGTYQLAGVTVPGGSLVSSNRTLVETNFFGGVWEVERTVWKLATAPGTEVVTLASGVFSSALVDQVVVDTLTVDVPPPADLVLNTDSGVCQRANVTWTVAGVDGCVISSVVNTPASGSTFAKGTNPVHSVVYDSLGGNKSYDFAVIVRDMEPPVVTCPANMMVAKGAGCGAVVNFTPTATDNCGATTIVSVPASGSEFPLGLTTVTCTATDTSGNVSAPCTFTVRVVDVSGDLGAAPCWRGRTNATYQHFAFSTGANPEAPEWWTNLVGAASADTTVGFLGSGWLEDVGILGCRQGVWELGSSGSIDVTIPETAGSVNGYRYVVVQATGYRDGGTYQLAGVTVPGGSLVSSNRTLVETNFFGGVWEVERTVWKLATAPGTEVVTLASGVFSSALVDQVVVDTLTVDVPPPADLVLNTDSGVCQRANVTWTVAGVDGCVISSVVNTPASGSTFAKGTNPVHSVVYDSLGGNKSYDFAVIVRDMEPPVVTCPANMMVAKGAGCGAVVNFTPTATDNCGATTIVSVPASGSEFPLGLTTVTCTATDTSGNVSAPCTFTVRVVDVSGDLGAAPCWRGRTNATYQHFAFSTGANPEAPEWWTNLVGAASADTTVGFLGSGWLEDVGILGCRQGVWELGSSGSIDVTIPETAGSVNGYRYVVVQATGYRDGGTYQLAGVTVPGGSLVSSNRTLVETNFFGGVWEVERTVWKLATAPGTEVVTLASGVFSSALVDQVVVDTLTVDYPCPADVSGVADVGQCGKANVTWTVAALDGCTVTNVISSPPSGSTFPVGTVPVTCQIADALGGVRTCVFNVTITDTQPPVIALVSATEVQPYIGTVVVEASANTAVQGIVNLSVQASDNCTLVGGHPLVALTNGVATANATFVNQSPPGSYNYTWAIGPLTAPGTWIATVSATDSAVTTVSNLTLCVDVNQISGQVELEDFVGASRTVTFFATGGSSTRSWSVPLAFTGAVASYVLPSVPSGTLGLSAKTDWNLRRKLAVTLNGNGQGSANFTAAAKLRGGDFDGDNFVSGDDYDILVQYWLQPSAAADVDGSGGVINGDDYDIFVRNWLQPGDAP